MSAYQEFEKLQEQIGYCFQDDSLLLLALTHSSYANETGMKNHHLYCNERLEFLGDSILSAVSSTFLYEKYPDRPEGILTRIRSAIVCETALNAFAEQLHLGEYLLLGKGEMNSGGAKKPAILADAFEALLAAIYLDSGDGLFTVSKFLLPFLKKAMDSMQLFDAKSLLQELVEKDDPANKPEYRIEHEEGPDHAKKYEIAVYLNSNCIGRGEGSSKRHAEQAAAAEALKLFGINQE